MTRVRMEIKGGTNKKEKEAGGEKTEGEERGSWDSWDTGEGCRPIKKITTQWKERLQGKWVGQGLQTGAAFSCHQHTPGHLGNKTFFQNPQGKLRVETEDETQQRENTPKAGKSP